MTSDENNPYDYGDGISVWGLMGTVASVWAAFNMDRTHTIAHNVADNVGLLPHELAGWLAWTLITWGIVGVVILLIAVGLLAIVVATLLADVVA